MSKRRKRRFDYCPPLLSLLSLSNNLDLIAPPFDNPEFCSLFGASGCQVDKGFHNRSLLLYRFYGGFIRVPRLIRLSQTIWQVAAPSNSPKDILLDAITQHNWPTNDDHDDIFQTATEYPSLVCLVQVWRSFIDIRSSCVERTPRAHSCATFWLNAGLLYSTLLLLEREWNMASDKFPKLVSYRQTTSNV